MGAYVYPFKQADEPTKRAVWNKGQIVPGYDPAVWRRDACGHAIKFADHANTNSENGWEIDHIYPRAKGGQTTLDNLQPLYWQTNRSKGDNYPWSCN